MCRWRVFLIALAFIDSPASAAEIVDLELVLALDVSSSVNFNEYRLQMQGYADAFADARLQQAITEFAPDGVAVALVHWAGAAEQRAVVDWRLVRNPSDAAAFAESVAQVPRAYPGSRTAIGAALRFGAGLFADNGFDGRRRVIDLSGDGRNNDGEMPAAVRDAVAGAVTINTLAIRSDVPALAVYYRDNVIGGPGAFVQSVDRFEDFGAAILSKLVDEIRGVPIAGTSGAAPDLAAHDR